jgi:lipoate-protein ligase A
MRFLDLTLPTIEENLALDEALLRSAEAGEQEETLRLWDWRAPTVVLGAACRLESDVFESNCLKANVTIVRRSSGGGTVLLGPGCLLYSLVLAYERSPQLQQINPSYDFVLGAVADALRPIAPDIAKVGVSDLAVKERKVSGNAQHRKRNYLLHHGTLLYGFDAALVRHYLAIPSRQPDYRSGRDHGEFLTNLPSGRSELADLLRSAWCADASCPNPPLEETQRLSSEKYRQPGWTRRFT